MKLCGVQKTITTRKLYKYLKDIHKHIMYLEKRYNKMQKAVDRMNKEKQDALQTVIKRDRQIKDLERHVVNLKRKL